VSASVALAIATVFPASDILEASRLNRQEGAHHSDMDYYAHSAFGRREQDWEPLSRHLQEVEKGAGSRGGRFGAPALAALAGRLHDVGKYSQAFQARLRDPGQRADHSTAGALWARESVTQPWGELLAHVVAGHHAGLKDGLLDPEGRLSTKSAILATVKSAAQADGLILSKGVSGPTGFRFTKAEGGFQRAFLTRMIFSCLIDADREAAARFDATARGDQIETSTHPSIAELEATLLDSIGQRKTAPSALNARRDDVLRAAVSHAADATGVFMVTVPTGGGKTLTSLAFALAHARAHGQDRVIVVIPFTSIIEQTASVYRTALGAFSDAVLEHHSAFEMQDEAKWSEKRVGPDRLRLAMERWDSPIVVTTAVQFFESLFANRPSRCRKLHSLARSVVVVDEAQTMPLVRLLLQEVLGETNKEP
jgi:CRISPR-associated endonuclease/helicase Cas3